MGQFSIGGLASGLDTKSIISQLMSIESRPKTKLQWAQQLEQSRRNVWNDLGARMSSLATASKSLLAFETWQVPAAGAPPTPPPAGAWGATSADPSRLSATVSGTPTAATYAVNVQQLSQGEVDQSTGTLGVATSGVRASSGFYAGTTGTAATAASTLISLKNSAGTSLAVNAGSTITLNYAVNGGAAQSATYTVTSTSKLSDLQAFVQSTVGNGATVAINAGKLEVTTAPGTANELTTLNMTSKKANGTVNAAFNTSQSTSTQKTAATNAGVSSAETFTITQGASTWNVALAAGDDIAAIASKINATSGVGVFASVVSGKLQLASNAQGAASAFAVSSSGTTATKLGLAETQAAQDARYTVDGTLYTSTTNNNVGGAIAGVTLNLSGVTNTTLTVAQGSSSSSSPAAADPRKAWEDSVVAKVKAFADSYNATLDLVYQRTQAESKVTTPADKTNGLTLSEYLQGPMARNVQFGGVANDLKRQVGDAVSGLANGSNTLTDVGIKIAYAKGAASGKLEVDETALRAALQSDPTRVQQVLGQVGASNSVSADDGIVRRVSEMAANFRATDGSIGSALGGQDAKIKSLQQSIDRATNNLEKRQSYYEKMYASLETVLGRLQSQSSWLSGQLSGLMGGNGG